MKCSSRRAGGCAALIGSLLLAPVSGLAAEDAAEDATEEVPTRSTAQRIGDSTFDVLLLRPSGFVVLVAGAGLFVPAAATSALGGKEAFSRARETFVGKPAAFLFTRPLGEF